MWYYSVLLFVFGFSKCVSSSPNYDSEIIFGDDYINDEIPKFQQLTTSFDLGGLMSGNRMAGVPLGRSLGEGELDVEGVCSESGFACQNCTHAVTCILLPVGWLKLPLQECQEGKSCNAHEERCSDNVVPECDTKGMEFKHTCEQVGIFPDAYDCRKFHLCSPAEGLMDDRPADHRVALCPRHYGYDPRIAQCSVKLHRGQCIEKPVPGCREIGESAVLPSSPNHYYVCVLRNGQLYPQIFICPHGWVFVDGFCRPEPEKPQSTPKIEDNRFNFPPEEIDNKHVRPEERDGSSIVQDSSSDMDSHDSNFDNHHHFTNFENPADNMGHDNQDFQDNYKHNEQNSNTESREGIPHFHNQNTDFEEKHNIVSETSSDEKPGITRIEAFFSTERTSTYAADTFLADKFDLSNYETIDDSPPPSDDFTNSFESGVDFW